MLGTSQRLKIRQASLTTGHVVLSPRSGQPPGADRKTDQGVGGKEGETAAGGRGWLRFDEGVEGGNLGDVRRSEDGGEYEIYLRHDAMNPRFRLWFHFCVSNNTPDQRAVATIVNFSKTRSLFKSGMTPVMRAGGCSQWSRMPPKDVFYYKSAKHNCHVLSMALKFGRSGDGYEIAYSFPYPYTRMQYELAWLDHLRLPFVRRQLLC
ncbi:unnamed protein product, partial [Ostreobium quekettii]|eukprot:evm.model.scf_3045.1 EVM.evm.TU.scf_3045.1   scf_3045:116-1630(-)